MVKVMGLQALLPSSACTENEEQVLQGGRGIISHNSNICVLNSNCFELWLSRFRPDPVTHTVDVWAGLSTPAIWPSYLSVVEASKLLVTTPLKPLPSEPLILTLTA